MVPSLEERKARLSENDWKILNDPPFKPRGIKTVESYRKKKPKGAPWWWDLTPEQKAKAERKLYWLKRKYADQLADPKIAHWKLPLLIGNVKANVLHPLPAKNLWEYRKRLYSKKTTLRRIRKRYHKLRAYLEGVIDEYPLWKRPSTKKQNRNFQVPLG